MNEFLGFNGSDDGLGFADGGVGVVGCFTERYEVETKRRD